MYKVIPGMWVSNPHTIEAIRMAQPFCDCRGMEIRRFFRHKGFSFWSHLPHCILLNSELSAEFDSDIWKSFLQDPGNLPNCAKCLSCGSKTSLTIDHTIPQKYGGTNALENYRILCNSCNHKRGSHINVHIWALMSQVQREAFVASLKNEVGSGPTSRIRSHLMNNGRFDDIYKTLFWIGACGFTTEARKIEDNICLNSKKS